MSVTERDTNDLGASTTGKSQNEHSFLTKYIDIQLYSSGSSGLMRNIYLSDGNIYCEIQFRSYAPGENPDEPSYDNSTRTIKIHQDTICFHEFIDTIQNSKNVRVRYYETSETGLIKNAMVTGSNV